MRIMDYSRIVSKIAVDKDSIRLGKIIRIDELLGKTIKKGVVVPIDVERITKVGGQYVWFDILKEEFDEQVKTAKTIQTQREIYTGDTGLHQLSKKGFGNWSYERSRLSRKYKKRKR